MTALPVSRLVPFDAAVFEPGTYGFTGACSACSGQRPASFMLRVRYRRRGRLVTAHRPLCSACAERHQPKGEAP